VPIMSFNSYR